MDYLKVIADALTAAGVPYEYGQWNSAVEYPYWVGSYVEAPASTEDGLITADFTLSGTTKGTWAGLEAHRSKIMAAFPPVSGLVKNGANGTVAVYYGNAQNVPTDVAELKRMGITLQVMEWRN